MNLSAHEITEYFIATAHEHKHLYFVQDFVLVPILLFVIFSFLVKKRKNLAPELQPFYLAGFYLKLLAIPLFLFHHTFIYKGGVDQFTYYWCSNEVIQLFYLKPMMGLKILFTSSEILNASDFNFYLSNMIFAPNETFCVKLTAILSMLTGNSYLVSSIILSFFAYLGCWKIYTLVNQFYPGHAKLFAYSTIFVPSVFFWASVISKEVYCIGAMGFLFYYMMDFFYYKHYSMKNGLAILVFGYIIFRIKIYILIALIVGFVFFLLFNSLEKVKSNFLRIMILPISLAIVSLLLFLVWSSFENVLNQFAFTNILGTIKTNYDYLTQENFASSRYTLGKIEPNIGSIARLIPASINVTLFRPYLWEANKPITLLAAIESLLTLGLTLFVIWKVRLRVFYFLFTEKFILFCIIFSLTFGAAVGLTSGNFGTLMRYKIPFMPFYYSALAIIYVLWKRHKKSVIEKEAMC